MTLFESVIDSLIKLGLLGRGGDVVSCPENSFGTEVIINCFLRSIYEVIMFPCFIGVYTMALLRFRRQTLSAHLPYALDV